MVAAVTPRALTSSQIVTGGVAVEAVPVNPAGGILQNPYTAADQGGVDPPEILYVDPVNSPGSTPGSGNGTCFAIYPGQTWEVIPGQTTPTRMNAATSGHKVSGVYW